MKKRLVSALTLLVLIGLIGCNKAPTTLTEKKMSQEQTQENKLAKSTADKANKVLEYINEYITAYREYEEARQNGTKSTITSMLTSEELMDVPYSSLFGQENYIIISDNILNHENIKIKLSQEDYNQYDENKLMQINSNLDKIILLASNEIIFDASELTKEISEEKTEQKQEESKTSEGNYVDEYAEDHAYQQVIACIKSSAKDSEFFASQLLDLYKNGDFETIKQYCNGFLTTTEGLDQYQIGGDVHSALTKLREAYSILEGLVWDEYKFEVGVYGWIDIINEETNNLIKALQ